MSVPNENTSRCATTAGTPCESRKLTRPSGPEEVMLRELLHCTDILPGSVAERRGVCWAYV